MAKPSKYVSIKMSVEKFLVFYTSMYAFGFSVDSDRCTLGFSIVRKQKRKIRVKKKSSGITPDEPSELENLLKTIIALEEGADAELQKLKAENAKKLKRPRFKPIIGKVICDQEKIILK